MPSTVTSSQRATSQHLSVYGQRKLQGTLSVSGAKNSALVLMTASLLTEEVVEAEDGLHYIRLQELDESFTVSLDESGEEVLVEFVEFDDVDYILEGVFEDEEGNLFACMLSESDFEDEDEDVEEVDENAEKGYKGMKGGSKEAKAEEMRRKKKAKKADKPAEEADDEDED